MHHPLLRLLIAGLLMLFVVAPFAGLAPLFLLIFVVAAVYAIATLVQTAVGDRSDAQ